jgi:hypothetical protein
MDVKSSLAFRSALSDPDLGIVSGVHDFEVSPLIRRVDRPVYVVSCYSDTIRTICYEYKRFILLIHNSYTLSFANNIGLAWLYHSHRRSLDLRAFTTGFAKKFVGEQMYRLRPSMMARVLFLESALAYEPAWREPVLAKEKDKELHDSSDLLTRIAADLIFHHELGHLAEKDGRFASFIQRKVDAYLEDFDGAALPVEQIQLLRSEAEADLFAINCCLARYAPRMRAERVREYLNFVARLIIAINVLYVFSDDLHRVNVDPEHVMEPVERALTRWMHREAIMVGYIESFEFGRETIETRTNDRYLGLPQAASLFDGLTDSNQLIACENSDLRRFAQTIDAGFAAGSFDKVIEGIRSSWMLGEPVLADD